MAGDSQVQEIKDKLPINEVVGQYVTLRRAGRNFVGRCPFHKERTPSFHVSPERNSYMCFGCGEKGDIFTFVEKIDGVDFKTALKQLADRAGVVLVQRSFKDQSQVQVEKDKEERLLEVCEEAAKFFEYKLSERKDVRDYLHTRGATNETIMLWRLGYAPASWDDLVKHLTSRGFSKNEIVDSGLAAKSDRSASGDGSERIYDRFRGRIMFPLFDASGKVIAFSGRIFEEMKPKTSEGRSADVSPNETFSAKYVNSPETLLFKKSKVLYGLDKARAAIRKADCILLVEGQFDLILAHQSGLPFTVASSGTAITIEHLSLLGRLSKRLVLALDGDAAGLRAGLKTAAAAYAAGFDVKIPAFKGGKDPADLARENPELLKAAIRTSRTAVEFFLEALRTGTRDERAYKLLVEQQLLPLVAAIPSTIDQAHFVHIIAEHIEVPETAVRESLKRATKQPASCDAAVEGESTSLVRIEAVPLERAAAMLAFRFTGDVEQSAKLGKLVGIERLKAVIERLAPEKERLLFEFESLQGDKSMHISSLFDSIERSLLEEEMKSIRASMPHSSSADFPSLSKRLLDLKRREQELRK